ncbi:MAG: pyridoxamine 5'-phosphate oxidase, partial [Alteraurantiacibacter sp.]|nr:pyridoxamine 5'-phosphate oxidase [Alteraurantiacibacter sp.]
MQDTDNAIPAEADPFVLFQTWFDAALASEPNDPNAMALATATPDGQ